MSPGRLRRWGPWFALALAGLLLIVGMLAPVIRFTALGVFDDTRSLLGGALHLMASDAPLLGTVILLFSVVLPLVKLVVLARVQLRSSTGGGGPPPLWMAALGKWSMLDVFVVAILMGCVQLGLLSEARAEWGVVPFAAGVMLSMAITVWITSRLPDAAVDPPPRWCDVATTLLLAGGIVTPLMRVEKWWFWKQEFSLLGALPALWQAGEYLLPVVLFLFVVLVPALVVVLRLGPLRIGAVPGLGKWSMLDVFVLGLVLVVWKLSSGGQVTPRIGFWLLLGAVLSEGLGRWLAVRRAAPAGIADQP